MIGLALIAIGLGLLIISSIDNLVKATREQTNQLKIITDALRTIGESK